MVSIDELDLYLLTELQRNARMSNAQLAEGAGISAAYCSRRVRQLQESGVILGFHARLDRSKIGLPLTIFADVRVDQGSHETARTFMDAVQRMPNIVACRRILGHSYFLLELVVQDISTYETVILEQLWRIAGVTDIRSSFSIQDYAAQTVLPLLQTREAGAVTEVDVD